MKKQVDRPGPDGLCGGSRMNDMSFLGTRGEAETAEEFGCTR